MLPLSYLHTQEIQKKIDNQEYITETITPKITKEKNIENKINQKKQETLQNIKNEILNGVYKQMRHYKIEKKLHDLYEQIKYYQTQIYNKMLKENKKTEITDDDVIFRRLYTSEDFSQDSFPGTKIEILKTNKCNIIFITDYQGEVQLYYDYNCNGLKMPESTIHKKFGRYDGYFEYNVNFDIVDKKFVQEDNLLNIETLEEYNQKYLYILKKIDENYEYLLFE